MILAFAKPVPSPLMRSLLLALLCGTASLVACKKKSVPPPPPPTDPAASLKEPTLEELNLAVQAWFTSRGQAPASLEEMAKARFIPKVPTPPPGREFVIDKEKLCVVVK